MPTDPAFGGGVQQTTLGPPVMILMLVIIGLVFLLPRRLVLTPLMLGLFLLPVGQTLVVGGLHVFVARIFVAAGLIRAVISKPSKTLFGGGYSTVDKLFIVEVVCRALTFIVLFGEMGAMINQLGFLWDTLGGFLLMRFLIVDKGDIQRTIKLFAGIAVILGASMLYEKVSGVNIYTLLAGYRIIPERRYGSIRAQGPFHHAVLAGTFGATLLPLFIWLWKSGNSKFLGVISIFASTGIVVCSASSTPVSAYLAAILAICCWPLKRAMRAVRWSIVIAIFSLNLVMHAPVWWAIEHVDFAGGSAGEQRAELIDNFVRHFGDWWLVGTKDNAKWGFEMWDISNQYIAEGETGGLLAFILFIALLSVCYSRIGKVRKIAEAKNDRKQEWFLWLIGASLFAHTMAFFGISYFDQTRYAWFALLAMISVVTASRVETSRRPRLFEADLYQIPDFRLSRERAHPIT